MRQRGVAALEACQQPQQILLPILAQRIERDQARRRVDGATTVAAAVKSLGAAFEHLGRHRLEAAAFPVRPIVECFGAKAEFREKVAAIERGGALALLRVGRSRQRGERVHIDCQGVRRQSDLVAVEMQQIGGNRRQVPAQLPQAFPKAVTRLLVEAVSPQQRRELLARRAAAWAHGQVGHEREGFLRRDAERRRRSAGAADGKSAEKLQSRGAHSFPRNDALCWV